MQGVLVIIAATVIQFAAVTAPVFVPAAAPSLVLNWQPEYPDEVRSAVLPTACQQSYAKPPVPPPPPTGWMGTDYPERVEHKTYPTSAQPTVVAGFRPIIPVASSWEARFPDRPAVAALPVAASSQSFAAGFRPIIPPVTAWEGTFPDRIFRAEAGQQAGAVFVFDPGTPAAAPLLSWGPRYPDQPVAAAFPFAATAQAFASGFRPIIPTITAWQGTFPDRIAKSESALPTGFAFVAEQAAPVAPPLSWGPQYPDRPGVAGLPIATSAQAFATSDVRPQLVQAAGTPVIIVAPTSIQYAAVTGPIFFPAVVPPALNWQPAYPDGIQPPRFLTAAQQSVARPVEPPAVVPPPPFGWLGSTQIPVRVEFNVTLEMGRSVLAVAPEFALSASAKYPDWFSRPRAVPPAGETRPPVFAAPATPALSWKATYPDRVPAATAVPAALQRAHFAPVAPPVAPAPPSWKAVHPDRVQVLTLPTALSRFYFAPEATLPSAPAPTLSWGPSFPDRAPGASFPTALQQATTPALRPIVIVLRWSAEFPSWLPPQADVSRAPAYFAPVATLATPPAPLGSWNPSFPDRAPGSSFPTALRQSVTPATRPIIVVLRWSAEFPAWTPPRADVSRVPAYFAPVATLATPSPLGSWSPSFPAQFFSPFPAAPFVVGARPVAPPPPPRGWYPSFPDRFAQPYVAPTSGASAAFRAPASPLSWSPSFPARAPGALLPTALHQASTPATRLVVIVLRWGTEYPSWLPPRVDISRVPSYFAPEATLPTTWQPIARPGAATYTTVISIGTTTTTVLGGATTTVLLDGTTEA